MQSRCRSCTWYKSMETRDYGNYACNYEGALAKIRLRTERRAALMFRLLELNMEHTASVMQCTSSSSSFQSHVHKHACIYTAWYTCKSLIFFIALSLVAWESPMQYRIAAVRYWVILLQIRLISCSRSSSTSYVSCDLRALYTLYQIVTLCFILQGLIFFFFSTMFQESLNSDLEDGQCMLTGKSFMYDWRARGRETRIGIFLFIFLS